MAWSKMSIHKDPYWPSMITYDPESFRFIKGKRRRQFHVQFLRDNDTSWIAESSMIPYEGHAAYLIMLKEKFRKVTNNRKRKKYVVPFERREAWDKAVMIAERAYRSSRDMRNQHMFQYEPQKAIRQAEEEAEADLEKLKKKYSMHHP